MQKLLNEYLEELNKRHKKRRKARIAMLLLAVLVVGSVAGVLAQYGIAMTGTAYCGLEEHVHKEECYEKSLVCALAEGDGHVHSQECYEQGLICGQEESEEHAHSQECYGSTENLICGQEELEGHMHMEACYESGLACGKEEHTHTDICYIDVNADVEEQSLWDRQYGGVQWKGAWGEDLVMAARQQIGYQESINNYQVMEDGTHKGYTRYGAFLGNPYCDWDGAFVSFCLYYAGLQGTGLFPAAANTAEWLSAFTNIQADNGNYLAEPGDYIPQAGDLVFFRRPQEEPADQMGIVSFSNEESRMIWVIEGDSGNEVKENEYGYGENQIVRYLKVTELEAAYKGSPREEEPDTDPETEEPEGSAEPKDTILEDAPADGIYKSDSSPVDASPEDVPEGGIPEWAASIPVEGSEKGQMVLQLRYADKKNHDEKEAEVGSPHIIGRVGYFELYAKAVEGNLEMEDLTVTLHFPTEYFDPKSIKIEPFNEPDHSVSDVTEKDGYYEISITFPEYRQTGQIQYEFRMGFYGGIVPADETVGIYATLSSGKGENEKTADTAENFYRPTYEKPKLTKYVNTNQYESMSEDHTRVSTTIDETTGSITQNEYVSFWYKLNGDPWYFREYDQVTLTDILPTYIDTQGTERIATFDPELNPGWELSEDRKTVSRTFTTDWTCRDKGEGDHHWTAAVKLSEQVQQAELKLKFPDCKIDDPANDGFLKKELTNTVEAECHPRDPSEGEQNDRLTDDLIFTLTNQPVGAGFAKYNSYNVLMDIKPIREEPYRWGILFENSESAEPLKNIVVTDYELDGRLKLHSLRLDTEAKAEWKAQNRIDRVEATTYDGETDTYGADEFVDRPYNEGSMGHNQLLELDPEKEYKEFRIYMKDGYELPLGGKIHVGVYTTFREPDKTHYIDTDVKDDPQNAYHNGAQVMYAVRDKTYFVDTGNQFSLIKATENLEISKQIMYGSEVSIGEQNKFWMVTLKGSLLDKPYEDLTVVDVLPEPFIYEGLGVGEALIREVQVLENFQNTGRTAVYFKLNADELKKALGGSSDANGSSTLFTFKTSVRPDARVGTFENEIYLWSEDLERITTQATRKDTYDLNGNGNREEEIRGTTASCLIKSPSGVFSEKLIAPKGSNAWRKSDLFLGVGDEFQYKLCVINAGETLHRGLVAYDVLPAIGDRGIGGTGERGSEYGVKLSGAITPPPGYQVFYTASTAVYSCSMADIMADTSEEKERTIEWSETIDNLDAVTAFKFVAEEGTTIPANGRVEFVIPVKVVNTLGQESYEFLHQKESADRIEGTATYLKATNSFGYRVDTFSGNYLESNYVSAQIPFAGFVVKKVEANAEETTLSGAEFKLEKQMPADIGGDGDTREEEASEESPKPAESWSLIGTKTTDENGILSFRDLTEGTYRLTETKAPTGYILDATPISVTITLNRETMEYEVRMEGNEHAGNKGDPFVVENQIAYELPSTGGMGIHWCTIGGVLLMAAASWITYRSNILKRKGESV